MNAFYNEGWNNGNFDFTGVVCGEKNCAMENNFDGGGGDIDD